MCLLMMLGHSNRTRCVKHEMETKLHRYLLDTYDSNVVPLKYDEPLPVNVSFTLLRIRNFDEVEEVLQTNGIFNIRWTDMRLSWNETEFGNLSDTVLKQEILWVPDITNANSVKEFKSLGEPGMPLKLASSGHVSWRAILTMETACAIDTRYFPFDRQTCKISVMPWHANAKVIILYGDGFSLRPISQNGHWKVVSSKIKAFFRSKSHLEFIFDLKRRSQYYIMTLLLPILAVSILTCFSFLLSRHSGEKISYSITVFLSYMVLMSFITNSLPKTSTEKPILVEYIGAMILLALVSVIWSVLTSFYAVGSLARNTADPHQENDEALLTTDGMEQSTEKKLDFEESNVKIAYLTPTPRHIVKCDNDKSQPDNQRTSCTAQWFSPESKIGAEKTNQSPKCTRKISTKQYLKQLDFAMFLISTLVTVILTFCTLSTLSEND